MATFIIFSFFISVKIIDAEKQEKKKMSQDVKFLELAFMYAICRYISDDITYQI